MVNLQDLHNHPDWSLAPGASDIFVYRRNPDITLGPEEQGSGPYSLTSGDGSVFQQGSIDILLNVAGLFAERP